jgi:shikimate kinase
MKRIFLVGFMGAGKTTLGKALARRMGLSFIDTDNFIENRYHKKVSEIFSLNGEEYFRTVEHTILREISEFENIVVSTGGGLPCFNDNMKLMNRAGITVFLDLSPQALASRLQTSKTVRPVLQGRTGHELSTFIENTLSARRPFYTLSKILFDVELMDTANDVDLLAAKLDALITMNESNDER